MALFSGFKATTIFKAFMLNAFVAAIVATLIIELRIALQNEKNWLYEYFNTYWFPGGSPQLTNLQKIQSTFIVGFIASLIVYNFLYVIFGFGGGMLSSSKDFSYF